jgi:hypothetical protein
VEKRLGAAVFDGDNGAPVADDRNGDVLQHKGDEGKVGGIHSMGDGLEAQLTKTEHRR